MNNKEAEKIATNMAVALNSFFDRNSSAESVTNDAMITIREIIKENPKIKDILGDYYQGYNSDDKDFKNLYDREIEWLRFIK